MKISRMPEAEPDSRRACTNSTRWRNKKVPSGTLFGKTRAAYIDGRNRNKTRPQRSGFPYTINATELY